MVILLFFLWCLQLYLFYSFQVPGHSLARYWHNLMSPLLINFCETTGTWVPLKPSWLEKILSIFCLPGTINVPLNFVWHWSSYLGGIRVYSAIFLVPSFLWEANHPGIVLPLIKERKEAVTIKDIGNWSFDDNLVTHNFCKVTLLILICSKAREMD